MFAAGERIRRRFYRSDLTPAFVEGMNRFARAIEILDEDVPYSEVVAEQFRQYWNRSVPENA